MSQRAVPFWVIVLAVGLCVAAELGYVAIEYGPSAIPGFLVVCLVLAVVAPIVVLLASS